MVRKDEISSTEKLLDLIRETPLPPSAANETGAASSRQPGLLNSLTFKKPIGIGVEIGNSDIKIAKINRISDKCCQ